MGNSVRCCLACILPCGALDVIRIVHLNGQVEEYSRQVSASEILAANPNHVISRPHCQRDHVVQRILLVSPESELKRGHIYFLIPSSSVPEKKKTRTKKLKQLRSKQTNSNTSTSIARASEQDEHLKQIISDNKSSHHRRRSGRVAMWRPHLESIAEAL